MSAKLKKILSALFIAASIFAVVIIAFSNPEMGNGWEAISRLEIPWIGGLLLCWIAFAGFETLGNQICLNKRGCRISFLRTFRTVLIGMYYSSITPGSAGGQPMQINALRKEGVPVEYGTLSLTVRFVMNQFTICMMTLALFLIHHDFVVQQLGGAIWAARIGWLINFAAVPLVVLATWKRSWVQGLANWLISLLAKIRIVRNKDAMITKVTDVLDTYNKAMLNLLKSPGQILIQFLCSFVSLLGMTATIIFVYHAFGQEGTPWYQLLTLSCLLYVSASYTPLPGASGAQEGGFLVFYNGIFKNGTIGMALLVWRFFTFYLFLLVGIGTVVLEKIILKKERKRRLLPENHPDPS